MPNLLPRFQKLGQDYIDRHKNDNFIQKLLHTNNNFAAQIAQFPHGDMESIRDFALEIYFRLPNTEGELAEALHYFITHDLNIDWNRDLYKYLPLNALQNIGVDYLKKYPTQNKFFSWHNHQEIALSLAAGKNHRNQTMLSEDSSYVERWQALLSAYSDLDNPFGEIAQKIESIIRLSHQSDYIHIIKTTNDRSAIPRNTGLIAQEIYAELYYIWRKAKPSIELADLRKSPRP